MLQIEFARRRKRWSQHQLSTASGVSQTWISAIERGVGLPTPEQRESLARALDVDPSTLLIPVIAPVLAEVS